MQESLRMFEDDEADSNRDSVVLFGRDMVHLRDWLAMVEMVEKRLAGVFPPAADPAKKTRKQKKKKEKKKQQKMMKKQQAEEKQGQSKKKD